jgi:hypothetical protein
VKEWAEVFKNKLVLFTVAFLPLRLVAMPLFMVGLTEAELDEAEVLPEAISATLCAGLGHTERPFNLISQFVRLQLVGIFKNCVHNCAHDA